MNDILIDNLTHKIECSPDMVKNNKVKPYLTLEHRLHESYEISKLLLPLNYEIPFTIVEDIFVLRYDLCFLETDYVILNNMLWLITIDECGKFKYIFRVQNDNSLEYHNFINKAVHSESIFIHKYLICFLNTYKDKRVYIIDEINHCLVMEPFFNSSIADKAEDTIDIINKLKTIFSKEELEKLYAESTLHHLSTF